jgi:hypothetical protein
MGYGDIFEIPQPSKDEVWLKLTKIFKEKVLNS